MIFIKIPIASMRLHGFYGWMHGLPLGVLKIAIITNKLENTFLQSAASVSNHHEYSIQRYGIQAVSFSAADLKEGKAQKFYFAKLNLSTMALKARKMPHKRAENFDNKLPFQQG